MPIFARTKLMIEEDCLQPRPKMIMNYSGPNPQNSYKKLIEMVRTHLKIGPENIQEKEFKWDRSGIPEKFSAAFEIIKDFDKFTHMLLGVSLSGDIKPSKDFGYEGSVTIEIDGVVRTEYPQDTIWQRSLPYEMLRTFWHRVFYQDKRYKYREQCRELMFTLQNEMKGFFNILAKV